MSLPASRMRSFFLLLMLAVPAVAAADGENFANTLPSPQQVAWQDLQFGVIIHFGTNTFLDREWGDGTAPASVFNPDQVDPGQWAQAVRAAGARYMVLVAKHHDGFSLWPTEQSSYSVKSSPWLHGKGDLVKLTSDAARAAGLSFGLYLSPWDRHEPKYADKAAYDKYYAAQLDELATGYGPLVEWWLDGAGSAGHVYDFDHYIEELRTYQPNTMVFADMALFSYGDIRWAGNEHGTTEGETWNVIDRHGQLRWRPVEVDTPLHKDHWFFSSKPDFAASLKTVDELMTTWEKSVGRGGQLMLGIAPNTHGLLPEADVKRLAEFGAAMERRYGNASNLVSRANPDAQTASALDNNPETFWSAPEGSSHAELYVNFPKPVTFDHAMTMERLDAGQHVRRYAIEVLRGNSWVPIAEGQAIGHLKLDTFPAVTAARIRLNIQSSVGVAQIRELKLFNTGISATE
jgi:alpha-L-fucosidase